MLSIPGGGFFSGFANTPKTRSIARDEGSTTNMTFLALIDESFLAYHGDDVLSEFIHPTKNITDFLYSNMHVRTFGLMIIESKQRIAIFGQPQTILMPSGYMVVGANFQTTASKIARRSPSL